MQELRDVVFLDGSRFFFRIIMVTFLFGDIVEISNCQRAFDIVILSHHLEWWYEVPHGYTSRSPVVPFDNILNSSRHISVVLMPVALSFIRALRNTTFQQNNARRHVADSVRLLSWPAFSSDLSAIHNDWSMDAEPLTHHYTPVATVYEMTSCWSCMDCYLYLNMPSNLCMIRCPNL